MKRFLSLILTFLISIAALAGPLDTNQIRITQNNTNVPSNGTFTRFLPVPASDCVLFFNTSTLLPDCATFAAGLSISSGVLTSAPPFSSISGLPTTLAGYGITDGLSSVAAASAYATQSALTSGLAGKYDAPIGTAAQYVRGDGSLATLPSGSGTVTSVGAGAGLSGGTITTSGTISMPNVGTPSTYSGVTTDAQGRVMSGSTRNFSAPSRTLNSCFQASGTRDAFTTYSVDIATTLSLTTGQQGTVYLETFTDASCATGTVEVARFVNGNTGALTIGLALTQNVTGTLSGIVPAGTYVKLRTQNNTGTPTFTYRSSQEVLL